VNRSSYCNGLIIVLSGGWDSSVGKSLDLQSKERLTAGGVFFWYGPSASLSLQIASVASEHHGKIMEVPTSG